jgi:hypothetical protein
MALKIAAVQRFKALFDDLDHDLDDNLQRQVLFRTALFCAA